MFVYGGQDTSSDRALANSYVADVAATVKSAIAMTRLRGFRISVYTNLNESRWIQDLAGLDGVDMHFFDNTTVGVLGMDLRGKQWLTRLSLLQNLPYDITFAIDAGFVVCHDSLADILRRIEFGAWDVALQTQQHNPSHIYPYGGILLLQRTPRTKRFLRRWLELHKQEVALEGKRDDQSSLFRALCEACGWPEGSLSTRMMHPRFSWAMRHLLPGQVDPSQSRIFSGPVVLAHWSTRYNRGQVDGWQALCEQLNNHTDLERSFMRAKDRHTMLTTIYELTSKQECFKWAPRNACQVEAIPADVDFFPLNFSLPATVSVCQRLRGTDRVST